MREWFARLIDWIRRDRLDRELAEELRFHRERLEGDEVAAGADADDARWAARRRLGNITRVVEESRDRWSLPALEGAAQDVRYALRGIRRSPAFAATVVLTFALGIGANAAMFDVVDRLMFRPLSRLEEPGTVHRLYFQWIQRGELQTRTSIGYKRYLDLQEWTRSFTDFAAIAERPLAVGTGADARERIVGAVSASFFGFFDAPPALGRYFAAAEDTTPRGADVAVLAHDFWTRELGRRDVLGETIQVGNVRATIVGVAHPDLPGVNAGEPPSVYIPITTFAASTGTNDARTYFSRYNWAWMTMLVRRDPSVTPEDASLDASRAFERSWEMQGTFEPLATVADARPRAIVSSVRPGAGPDPALEARTALWVSGVAAIVLLIACANVANLFVGRALRRQRETAVRLALGVSRGRLARQALTESLVLAIAGGVAGIVVAQWGGSAIRGMLVEDGSRSAGLASDWRTLGATAAVALLAGLLAAVAPVLLTLRGALAPALRIGAQRGAPPRTRVRAALLVAQGAMSVVLLVGAAMFVRSLQAVKAMPMGYDADPVLIVQRNLRGETLDDSAHARLRRTLLDAARGTPGVEAAAWASSAPFVSTSSTGLYVPGIDSVDALGQFTYQATTPDYFRVMGTRILRGRGFTEADRAGAPLVAVVSAGMARVLWPGREAIGQCMRVFVDTMPCTTVVGIAEDMVQRELAAPDRYHYYLPIEQFTRTRGWGMLLRLRGDPAVEQERVRRALQRVMPGASYLTTRPLRDVVEDQRRAWRLGATMFVAFGALALVVAGVGLYGVVGYDVSQRMHELGVRVALGARVGDLVSLVTGQSLRFALAGVALGTALAFAASPWLQPLLFGQSARDPVPYLLVGLAVVAVYVAASLAPARRAARADPNVALRAE